MKKKVLITMLSASLMCAVAAVTLAACGEEPVETTYSVTYVKSTLNETGSVPTDTAKYKEGAEVTVKGKGDLALDDYTFSGWEYDGKTYAEGDKVTMPAADVTFTAKWTQVAKYNVTYVLGEGAEWVEGSTPTGTTGLLAGTKITLPEYDAATKTDSEIYGWTIDGKNYEPGDTYTVNGDVTVTAVWGAEKISVYYQKSMMDSSSAVLIGRYAPNSEITLKAAPESWDSDVKTLNGLTNGGTTYQVGDTFTLGATNVTFIGEWSIASVRVNYYLTEAEKNDFDATPYKSDLVEVEETDGEYSVKGEYTVATVADADKLAGWDFGGWYVMEDFEFDPDYDIPDATTTEELTVYVYATWAKTVADFTASGWTNRASEKVNISYGETVTLTGTMTPGATNPYDGIFVSIGNTANKIITRRYDECALSDGDNAWNANFNTELGVKLAFSTSIVDGTTYEPYDYNDALITKMFGGELLRFNVVVDYTSKTKITITTVFSAAVTTAGTDGAEDVTDYYLYTGVATITARDAHVGLAQTYVVGISGETGSKLEGAKLFHGGVAADWAAPGANHDWTEDNDYTCTICGELKPDHPHDWTQANGWECSYCHQFNPAHAHNFVDNVCTICEGTKWETTVGGTTYVAALKDAPLANNDLGWNQWDGVTDRVEIAAEGDWVAYIKWDKTRDAQYYDAAAEILTEAAKETNSLSWDTVNRFRIDPGWYGSESGPFAGKFGTIVDVGTIPKEGKVEEGADVDASLGSYTALFVRVGNTITFSLTCERNGAVAWSRTCEIDASEITGKLYLQITCNPMFLDNLTCASASLSAVTAD